MAEENISLIRERQARIEQKVDDGFTNVLSRLDHLCCKEHLADVQDVKGDMKAWKMGVSVGFAIITILVALLGVAVNAIGHLK